MYQEKEKLVLEATFNRTRRKEIEKRGMKVEQELTVDIQGNENGGGTETDRRFPVIHAKARGLRPIARGAARVYTYVWILGESSNGRLSLGVGRRERGRWNFRFHSRQTLADRNPPPAIFSSTVSSSSMLSYAAWWEVVKREEKSLVSSCESEVASSDRWQPFNRTVVLRFEPKKL